MESDNTNLFSLFSNDNTQSDWSPTDDELACALELNTLSTFRSQFRRLKGGFNSFRAIFEAPRYQFGMFPDNALFLLDRFINERKKLQIGRELAKCPKEVKLITYFDSRYPEKLKQIENPPPVLYVKGDLTYDFNTSIAIVGSRIFTDYGRQMTEYFTYQLASWGFTIISGGARGIDSEAHRTALKAGGKTIAVFGCGIDVVFPPDNMKLFNEIASSGALVSEFPLGTIPEKYNFPMRNRIIAALGRGTLVIEAPEKSGALITAELAAQAGRDVFAIPGRLTDLRSAGANKLIMDGAMIASSPADIPLRFGLIVIEGKSEDTPLKASNLSADEARVYELTGIEAKNTDVIVQESGLPAQRVLSSLLMLQTKGLIRELPGGRFVRPVSSIIPPLKSNGHFNNS